MFKSSYFGRKNIVGINLKRLRKEKFPEFSQRQFAQKLQLEGLDVEKNRISKIELGESFVTDIELRIIAKVLDVSTDELLYVAPQELLNYEESHKKDIELALADKDE